MIPQWLVYARDHEVSRQCVLIMASGRVCLCEVVHRHVCAEESERTSFVLVKDLCVCMKEVVYCMLGWAPRTPPFLLCSFHQATAVLV